MELLPETVRLDGRYGDGVGRKGLLSLFNKSCIDQYRDHAIAPKNT